ncbi:MAG: hypothetical protein JXQ93_11555 [Flavobacteriaceae bacterium]
MNLEHFSTKQQSIITALSKGPLTSIEILKKVESIPMILKLYTVLDELNEKGIVKSYMERETKYHYIA